MTNYLPKISKAIITGATAFTLAACGGGGSGGSATTTTPVTPTPVTPTPVTPTPVTPTPIYQAPVANVTINPTQWYKGQAGSMSLEQSLNTTATMTATWDIDNTTSVSGQYNSFKTNAYIFNKTGAHTVKGCLNDIVTNTCDTKTVPVYKALSPIFEKVYVDSADKLSEVLQMDINITSDSMKSFIKQNPLLFSNDWKNLFLTQDLSGTTYSNFLFDSLTTNGSDEYRTVLHPAYGTTVDVIGINKTTKEFYIPIKVGVDTINGDDANYGYIANDSTILKQNNLGFLKGKFTNDQYNAIIAFIPPVPAVPAVPGAP